MSEEDKKRMINNVKATMAVESFNLTDENLQLLHDYVEGKITMEKALELIKNMILNKR